ncbi:MAG: amidohydrolase family protein [Nitrososphaerales archaeon]
MAHLKPKSGLTTILENCSIVDVEEGIVKEDVKIVVKHGLIEDILEGSRRVEGVVLDLQGCFVLPGLMNAHNNLSIDFPFEKTNPNEDPAITVLRCYRRALDALRSGVTTLRTVGEMHRADIALKKMINEGWVDGPRIVAGGKGLGSTGGHGAGFGQVEADGPYEFLKAARTELAYGADHIKIFISGGIAKPEEEFDEPQMTKEEMQAVTYAAKAKNTYVAAHAGGSNAIITAVAAGVSCFEHGYILNREAARAIKSVNGYLVPTLSVTRSPEWMRANKFNEAIIEKALSAADRHTESLKIAVSEGVTIVNGTDLPPGDLNGGVNATVREIEFLVEAGLSDLEALRAATLNAARLCRIADKVGVIKKGYYADLIAMPKNPLHDVKALRSIVFVMKDGQVFRDELKRR